MESIVKYVHSYWAYLVLAILLVAVANAIIGVVGKKEYQAKDFRISLFALIVTHLQFVFGLVLYILSGKILWFKDVPVKDIMGDPLLRLYNVEHTMVMIIAIALLTIGYSKHKKKLTSGPKFKSIAIFYTLSLVLMLSRIPWSIWI